MRWAKLPVRVFRLDATAEGTINVDYLIMRTPAPTVSSRNVENHREHFTNLRQYDRPNVSSCAENSGGGRRSNVLTLCRRNSRQTVFRLRLNLDFRIEVSNSRGQRDEMNDIRIVAEYPLRTYDNCGMAETGFATFGRPKVEINNVTRSQHLATRFPRRSRGHRVALRSGPAAATERQASPCFPPKFLAQQRASSTLHEFRRRSERWCFACK